MCDAVLPMASVEFLQLIICDYSIAQQELFVKYSCIIISVTQDLQ